MDVMAGIRSRIRRIVENSGKSGRAFSELAGLAPSHVNSIISGLAKNIEITTLLKIAAAANVSFEYLVVGAGQDPTTKIPPEIDAHGSETFRPGARAFLELEAYSASAIAVVTDVAKVPFDPGYRWTPEAWLEEFRSELRRRARGPHLRSG